MKLTQIVNEANVAAKLKDPKTIKRLTIAMRHDNTLPRTAVAKLGPKPSDTEIVQLWSDLLDQSLSRTNYGDVSADGKFDEWLTRLYINGVVDFEDINGEGGDALGAWKALSTRGRLAEPHQDFNKFKSLRQIQSIVQSREYRGDLERIKNAEEIEKHKREKKETTLIDDDRFLVTLPYNYGACYTFNNSAGFQASFCTGSSSGLRWFNRYAPEGPIISILDKENMDDENGKWQMHAPTGQMNNGNQTLSYARGDEKFAELYPGLMKRIVAAMKEKAQEINQESQEITRGGYDVNEAIAEIKRRLPQSYNAGEQEQQPEEEPQQQEPEAPAAEPEPQQQEPEAPAAAEPEEAPAQQTFLVTQLATGRQARIPARDLNHVQELVLQRYPDSTIDDYSWEVAD